MAPTRASSFPTPDPTCRPTPATRATPTEADVPGRKLSRVKRSRVLFIVTAATALAFACGETRRPIGDECLRDEDCLSSTCSARLCVPAPALVRGAPNAPAEEEPRIPAADAAPRDASPPQDAAGGG